MSEVEVRVERLLPNTFGWAAVLYGPGGKATLHYSTEQKEVLKTAEKVALVLNVRVIVSETE